MTVRWTVRAKPDRASQRETSSRPLPEKPTCFNKSVFNEIRLTASEILLCNMK